MRYWNSYFQQWLDDEDNDIPNDMPNDESNDCQDDCPDDLLEDEDNEHIIHFTEKEMEWWRELGEQIEKLDIYANLPSIQERYEEWKKNAGK